LAWELSNFSSEIEIINTFTSPEEALDYLKINQPDCLFLDIQMPTMDGFQFLEKLDNKDIAVIITTAYDEYAIKALKNEALDYLLKPIDSEELEHTIVRIKRFNNRVNSSNKIEAALESFNERFDKRKITINADGKLLFLEVEEVIFVESDGNYSTLHTTGKQKIVITKKLKEVDALLPCKHFFRIHNSYIVNLNKIKEYVKNEGYVLLSSNHRIPVARQRKSNFLDKL
ncbi:MAG: LytTR family DNA-binding domain-containing protein, partial [Bacteroidota bacterium]